MNLLKAVIAILMLIVTIQSAAADEQVETVLGDEELYAMIGDDQLGVLYASSYCGDGECKHWESSANCPQDCAVASGGGSNRGFKKYYDVIVKVLKGQYFEGQKVSSELIIDLIPESLYAQDGVLNYYLVSPSNENFSISQEYIKEGDNKKRLQLYLPTTAELGQWQFHAAWQVQDLPVLDSYDSFEVVEPSWYMKYWLFLWIGIVIIILLVIYTLYSYSRRDGGREHGKS